MRRRKRSKNDPDINIQQYLETIQRMDYPKETPSPPLPPTSSAL